MSRVETNVASQLQQLLNVVRVLNPQKSITLSKK